MQGFARGYALAHAFADEHGHLSIPYRHRRDGFLLGLWLSNQRAYGPRLPPERGRALTALDLWWNPPWSILWQRTYHRARRQVEAGTVADPGQGFDAFSENGSWLFHQCLKYETLYPQQRTLLARIGVTADGASAARRRRRSIEDSRNRRTRARPRLRRPHRPPVRTSRRHPLVTRMEKRGLLRRRPDPDDGRYTNAVLTEEGREHVRKAAPGHVAAVRQLIFDGLGYDGREELGRTVDRIVASLSQTDLPVTLPTPPEPGTGIPGLTVTAKTAPFDVSEHHKYSDP